MSNLIDRQAAIDAIDKCSVWVVYTQGDSQKDEAEFVESIIKQTKKAIQSMLIEDLPSAQPEQDILSWILAYHTKSFELHGRYMPHEVIGWLVHDFANVYMAERREE